MTIDKIFDEKYEIKGKVFYDTINYYKKKYKSLMTNEQMYFLMSIISENKMTNILEIGTYNGVSSLVMLKAGLKNNNNFKIYTIDISKDVNFIGKAIIDECTEEEQKHCSINIGKTAFDIESILPKNTKLDLVFIDGGHFHPTSLFNLLHVIPFTTKETVIVLHDIIGYMKPYCWGESFIFDSWTYKKYRLHTDKSSNMGCIQLHDNLDDMLINLKNIASMPFRASPYASYIYESPKKEYKYSNYGLPFPKYNIDKLFNYMLKYYDKQFAEEIRDILYNNYKEYVNNYLLYLHETRLFNYFLDQISFLNNRLSIIEKNNKVISVDNKVNSVDNKINNK